MDKLIEVEGIDYVVCQICREKFKQITQTHLNRHNISIYKYRKKYPNDLLQAKKIILQQIKSTKEFYKLYPEEKEKRVHIGVSNGMFDKHHSKESIELMSKNRRGKCIGNTNAGNMKGSNNPNWKGGIATERNLFISSIECKKWRISVFERDDYTCKECGNRGGNLNAHHILLYRDYPDSQYSLNIMNGITLCEKCHRKTFGKEYEFFSKYFDIANGIET